MKKSIFIILCLFFTNLGFAVDYTKNILLDTSTMSVTKWIFYDMHAVEFDIYIKDITDKNSIDLIEKSLIPFGLIQKSKEQILQDKIIELENRIKLLEEAIKRFMEIKTK